MPSIREAHERREALLREADAIWNKLAEELVALIPSSMQGYAREVGWIKSEIDDWWKFPEFLQYLVSTTLTGGCNSKKFRESTLKTDGFASIDQLNAALQDLQKAWKGIVRVEIDKEDGKWEVCFYATEFATSSGD